MSTLIKCYIDAHIVILLYYLQTQMLNVPQTYIPRRIQPQAKMYRYASALKKRWTNPPTKIWIMGKIDFLELKEALTSRAKSMLTQNASPLQL